MKRANLLNLMENGVDHIFIQGSAGTGKTHLINQFLSQTNKAVIAVGPTGLAVSHFGGSTIHSAFKFKPSLIIPEEIEKQPLFNAIEILIIDEISMVSCNLLDGIDQALKLSRGNKKPFGGVRLILVGDLYQLGPVVRDTDRKYLYHLNKNYKKSIYFFNAEAFKTIDQNFRIFNLMKNYRQCQDYLFYSLLEKIKTGSCDNRDLETLHFHTSIPTADSTILALTNDTVNFYNALACMNINKQHYLSTPQIITMDPECFRDVLDNPAAEPQIFVEDSLVIFTRNNKTEGYSNGTQGRIRNIESCSNKDDPISSIDVEILSGEQRGRTVTLHKQELRLMRPSFNRKTKKLHTIIAGKIIHFPLRCAQALTIHKAQGLTLDKICIDKGNQAFAAGQIYTALSRAPSLANVYLKEEITKEDVFADLSVIEFMKSHPVINVE